jgi:predicted transcriptional regulator
MLALGKPFERLLPDYAMADVALARSQSGHSLEEIAQGLQATTDEVRQWLEDAEAARQRAAQSPSRKHCSYCRKYIGVNTPARREMDLYYQGMRPSENARPS